MGTLVTVDSRSFLLQREDFAATLAALHEYAEENPDDFHDPEGVLATTSLPEALSAGDWHAGLDEHGDIVELSYGGDKYPDSLDSFPGMFFEMLAPFARHGVFHQTIEGYSAIVAHRLDDGEAWSTDYDDGLELCQVGDPPTARPGEPVTIRFEVRANGMGGDVATTTPVTVRAAHSTQMSVQVLTPEVPVGGRGEVMVTLRAGAADPASLHLSMLRDGRPCPPDTRIRISAPPDDRVREVIATRSPADDRRRAPVVLPTARFDLALRDAHRYADRHRGRPGAEFLDAVAGAADLGSALRAAGLEPDVSEAGLHSAGFAADRLPGYERHLAGLFWSLRHALTDDTWCQLAYRDAPRNWVTIGLRSREPSRDLSPRSGPAEN